jgi:hypothetical protein
LARPSARKSFSQAHKAKFLGLKTKFQLCKRWLYCAPFWLLNEKEFNSIVQKKNHLELNISPLSGEF